LKNFKELWMLVDLALIWVEECLVVEEEVVEVVLAYHPQLLILGHQKGLLVE
jgi:hypothetical protein